MGRGGAAGGRSGGGRSSSSHSSSSRSFSGRSTPGSSSGRGGRGGRGAFSGSGSSASSGSYNRQGQSGFAGGGRPAGWRTSPPPRPMFFRPRPFYDAPLPQDMYEDTTLHASPTRGNLLFLICALAVIVLLIMGGLVSGTDSHSRDITVSTTNRDPLGAEACAESSQWFDDQVECCF